MKGEVPANTLDIGGKVKSKEYAEMPAQIMRKPGGEERGETPFIVGRSFIFIIFLFSTRYLD
ncbi:MAG: hypothetical protein JRJ00_13080 [Deltaproteobacteria bacterium]|nr:hypothetical protein [Deltaproteobacteria bacterium]